MTQPRKRTSRERFGIAASVRVRPRASTAVSLLHNEWPPKRAPGLRHAQAPLEFPRVRAGGSEVSSARGGLVLPEAFLREQASVACEYCRLTGYRETPQRSISTW